MGVSYEFDVGNSHHGSRRIVSASDFIPEPGMLRWERCIRIVGPRGKTSAGVVSIHIAGLMLFITGEDKELRR